jgi:hypothetical protein
MFRRLMTRRYASRPVAYRRRGFAASYGATVVVVSLVVILILYFMGYIAL